PLGYRWNDDKSAFLVDAEGAAVVREVFRRYVSEGESLRGIAGRLIAQGIATPNGGTVWQASTLNRVLRDRAYIGEKVTYRPSVEKYYDAEGKKRRRVHRRPPEEHVVLRDVSPPIIDAILFETAQAKLDANRESRPGPSAQREHFLLRGGFIRCG